MALSRQWLKIRADQLKRQIAEAARWGNDEQALSTVAIKQHELHRIERALTVN